MCKISWLVIFSCWFFYLKLCDAKDLATLFAQHRIWPDLIEKTPAAIFKVRFGRDGDFIPAAGSVIKPEWIPDYIHSIECPTVCKGNSKAGRFVAIVFNPDTPDTLHAVNKYYLLTMCYIVLIEGNMPDWIPFINERGEHCKLVNYGQKSERIGKHRWVFLFIHTSIQHYNTSLLHANFTEEERKEFDLYKFTMTAYEKTPGLASEGGNIFIIDNPPPPTKPPEKFQKPTSPSKTGSDNFPGQGATCGILGDYYCGIYGPTATLIGVLACVVIGTILLVMRILALGKPKEEEEEEEEEEE